VAATFKGIVTAFREFQSKILEHGIKIYVRRGGPNYQEGLRLIREVGEELKIPLFVFGPETHMTAICGMAMGKTKVPDGNGKNQSEGTNFLLSTAGGSSVKLVKSEVVMEKKETTDGSENAETQVKPLFHRKTTAVIYGLQNKAVQGMLDFDFSCSRETPSVVAMVYPFSGNHRQKFYWGHKEILIPVYTKMAECCETHPEADVLINFASLRSAEEATLETLKYPQFRTIAIIAEGIPEFNTKKVNLQAKQKGVTIIGPATVGGIKPGCFKIGNTGGMLDNILSSKLYRPGSVAYVSRSGGMSNELNNIISRQTDGVYEGVAIGGDRYPGTSFMDHIIRYQNDPEAKIIVVLGEVGGVEEYDICESIKSGEITKPVVAWCIGTCGSMFSSEVQFGHAGACANSKAETSIEKNEELKKSGAFVPESFDQLPEIIRQVFQSEVEKGNVVIKPEVPPPTVPMDYNWAKELGLIRKPATFMTSISDERGQELIYAGMKISKIFEENIGIGGVLGLLWFQKRLPEYASKFIEMCMIVTADHGPAVSGAHNTIVCARAGKDLVSSLTSGLLTIGPRFGGALDGAAEMFTAAYDKSLLPNEFVNEAKKSKKLIMGIGHRIKSINNPDKRVEIIKNYVLENFPACPVLKYALEVEKVTTSKKPNLILNVDGCIAVCFVDLLRSSGCFTMTEADEYVKNGCLNALFVLGRSMGFIGHYLDQKRLKQGLYRHPWDDISYVLPEIDSEQSRPTGTENH
jgi:ATP citrate (pro-S)-lyase